MLIWYIVCSELYSVFKKKRKNVKNYSILLSLVGLFFKSIILLIFSNLRTVRFISIFFNIYIYIYIYNIKENSTDIMPL